MSVATRNVTNTKLATCGRKKKLQAEVEKEISADTRVFAYPLELQSTNEF